MMLSWPGWSVFTRFTTVWSAQRLGLDWYVPRRSAIFQFLWNCGRVMSTPPLIAPPLAQMSE